MGCAGHVAGMEEKRPAYKILTTKSEEKKLTETLSIDGGYY
jgi:hypothetical protein